MRQFEPRRLSQLLFGLFILITLVLITKPAHAGSSIYISLRLGWENTEVPRAYCCGSYSEITFNNPSKDPNIPDLTVITDDGWSLTVPRSQQKTYSYSSLTSNKVVHWYVKDYPLLKGEFEIFAPLKAEEIGTNSAKISWGKATPASGNTIKEYDIYIQNPTLNAPPDKIVGPDVTSLTLTGLRANGSFDVHVNVVYNETSGSAYSTEVVSFKTKPFTLTKPTELTANVQAKKVSLSWKASSFDPVSKVNSYIVYRNDKEISTVTTTSFTDQNVADGNYKYQVKAKDDYGVTSELSDSVTVKVGGASLQAPSSPSPEVASPSPDSTTTSPEPIDTTAVSANKTRGWVPWIIALVVIVLSGISYFIWRIRHKIGKVNMESN